MLRALHDPKQSEMTPPEKPRMLWRLRGVSEGFIAKHIDHTGFTWVLKDKPESNGATILSTKT
jgi:hypothetical protein